jgi:hypothetical protein
MTAGAGTDPLSPDPPCQRLRKPRRNRDAERNRRAHRRTGFARRPFTRNVWKARRVRTQTDGRPANGRADTCTVSTGSATTRQAGST